MPNTGPRDGWRIVTAARRPIRFSPWARPTVVVDLPSPRGVGLIAVTTTYLPRGFSASTRSIPAIVIFAFVCPYGSISSSRRPRSWATSMIGRGVTERAISRSDGKLIGILGWHGRRRGRQRWQARRRAGVVAHDPERSRARPAGPG